jgi:hypothetical protein
MFYSETGGTLVPTMPRASPYIGAVLAISYSCSPSAAACAKATGISCSRKATASAG